MVLEKGIIILGYFFMLSLSSFGQSTFIKTFGGVGREEANSAIITTDGNFLVVGYTTSYGSGGEDGLILKVDSSGTEIWTKSVGGSGNERFIDAIQLSNNDFLIVGWTESYGFGDKDLFITKVDNDGTILWTQTYGGTGEDVATTLIKTTDANVLVCGYTGSYGMGNLDVLLLKIDPNGNTIWNKTYGQGGNDYINGFGLIEDSQGNYLLAGAWSSNLGIPFHNGFLLKVDAYGDSIFSKIYGGNLHDSFNGHLREVNGLIQNIGISWSWNGSNHEIWMSELDSTGSIGWSKTFGLPNENIRIGSVFNANNNEYLISGYEFTSISTGNALILKVDHSGNVLWSQTYGGNGVEQLHCILESNNSIFAFGHTNTYGQGAEDILMLKADTLGNIPGCSSIASMTTTDVIPNEFFPSPGLGSIPPGQNVTPMVTHVNTHDSIICSLSPVAHFEVSEDTICQGDCIDLINTSLNIDHWKWIFTGADIDSSTILSPEKVCFSTVGTDTVTLVVSNSGVVDTHSLTITVLPSPDFSLGNDTIICSSHLLTLDASTPNATYLWSDGSTNPTLVVDTSAAYTVTVRLDECIASDTIHVSTPSLPKPGMLGNDSLVCEFGDFILNATASNAKHYRWNTGDTLPVIRITEPQLYAVTITIQNCEYTDSVLYEKHCIVEPPNCSFRIPNVFTPNGDGSNDIFMPESNCSYEVYELIIYNQWGDKIFDSQQKQRGWNGNRATDGVYFYSFCFKQTGSHQKKECIRGYFHLFH